jgi:hypothetical protein
VHVRGQIRAYVAARLAAVPGLQDHITLEARDVPNEAELPWALVSIGNENVSAYTLGNPRKLEREAELNIDLIGRDRADVARQIEDIAAEVETLLAADESMGGLAQSSGLVALTVDRIEGGSQPMLRLRLQYQITYQTASGAPTVAL